MITVPGDPKGKGRPRFTRAGFAYTPKDTVHYENLVKLAFQEAYPDWIPVEGPVIIVWRAFYTVPKSWSKKKKALIQAGKNAKTSKPDTDNIAKVKDALNGIVWKDDAQVYYEIIGKFYGDKPRLEVEIYVEEGKQ